MARRTYHRLNIQLLATMLLAALAALALAMTAKVAGDMLVREVYCSPTRAERRMQAAADSFRAYVAEHQVTSTDVEQIGRWNLTEPYVRVAVMANGTVLNSDRWGAELVRSDSGLVLRADTSGDSASQFPVNFQDGAYLVQFQEFSQDRLFDLVTWCAVIAAGILFLILVLLYSRRVTRAITRLGRQVRQVSQGDLTMEISPSTRDEIGDLAQDVDAMRLSIIDKLQREERAWRANTELITAISHDVRTPLTTLLGYLDLLSSGEALPPDRQREYLEVCRRKAEKLRTLTNELFSYFLVFGKPDPELAMEEYDAQTLLEQLVGEMAAELSDRGFTVNTIPLTRPGNIRVDVQHLRRVFDNLFSNVVKYADPAKPVTVTMAWVAEELRVSISNHILAQGGRPESTKIGLQTCQKLLTSMGGSFVGSQTQRVYTAQITLPECK